MTHMEIRYGKTRVVFFRLAKRSAPPFAASVDIDVFGERFRAAYTEGDNREVVATDTMKNFILRESLAYEGETLEGLIVHLGRGFLATYPVMEAVRMTGREHRFDRFSDKLFVRERGDQAVAVAELGPDGLRELRSGREDLLLLKVTGSAFTRFARDDYTTLPERVDRPLFIRMDVWWRYADPAHEYVSSLEVREELMRTFDDFVSESIQHLVHEMGTRMLARWPSLAEVRFEAENHTRDPAGEAEGRRIYTDPFPAQGLITLTLGRS